MKKNPLVSIEKQDSLTISVGEQLRLARINQNLSIQDISNRLKWPISKISDIEANEYKNLGGLTFIRGFVRSYAKRLGLNEEAILSELARQLQGLPQLEQANIAANFDPNKEPTSHRYGLFFFLLVLALLATFLWIYGHKPKPTLVNTQPLVVASSPVITSQPLASQVTASQTVINPPSNSQNSRLRLILVKPSYFTLIDAQGNKLHSGLLTAEAPAEFEGPAPFKIVIGAATDAQLFLNDRPVPLTDKTKGGVARFSLGE